MGTGSCWPLSSIALPLTLSFTNLFMFLSIQLVTGAREHYIIDPSRVTQISWRPRIFLYKGFLSEEECNHLISLTHGKLKRSRIVANATGVTIPSNKRTSSGMFLRPGQDEIVQRIERRIAAWTYLPEENGERIQILRYKRGEKFDVHNDYFSFAVNLRQGNRIATVLMYLSDVEKGGETFFPKVGPLQKKDDSWSFCASTVLAVKPKKGDALLFFNLKPNGGIDEFSQHGSCPVIEGVKWTATRWIHVIPYNNNITLGSNNHYVYRS